MRIAFLATPIIWLPAERGAGGIMGAFLTYNPFYHYLDIVRAPLLGHVVTPMSVQVVAGVTVTGIVVTYLFLSQTALPCAFVGIDDEKSH